MHAKFLLLAAFLLQTACATHRVLRDKEYETPANAYLVGDTELALAKFPSGEAGGFITTVEKSWLDVWNQHWDPSPLLGQVKTFDDRKFISLSREANYFLLQEAEEGYIPSEHEVVLLHLLAAIHYTQTHNPQEALVELRQAGYVLDHFWDDAGLRLWLGSLWAAAGHWEEAQVDFRRANQLHPSRELARLSEGAPPTEIYLHFYGEAPVLKWKEGDYVPVFLNEPSEPEALPIHASTLPWFARHQQRNSALRDVLVKSNFMAQYLGGKVLTGAERGANTVATTSIRVAAIAVGVAITAGLIYVMAQAPGIGSGDGSAIGYLFAGGIGVATGIWKYGGDLDRELEKSVTAGDQAKQEDLRIYRMVRFLPGWIGLSTNPLVEIGKSVALEAGGKTGAPRVFLVNHF